MAWVIYDHIKPLMLSSGAILFTPSLDIGNGRHRLRAVDLADLPITVDVAPTSPGLCAPVW